MKKLIVSIALLGFQVALGAGIPRDLQLTTECQEFISEIKDRYEFDWIKTEEVPGRRNYTHVFYYYRKGSQLKNPVIFFNGGPGFSSHSSYISLEVAKVKLGAGDIDFIYIDQRGTGCSSPFPTGGDRQTLERLEWYGSKGIVHDAEDLRKRLIGDRKWKVFGQSFGAYVVHRYIKFAPGGISKAYAHGHSVGPDDLEFAYSRIASQVTTLSEYFKKYPSDKQRLKILNAYLSDPSKCFRNRNSEYCGYEVFGGMNGQLGFQTHWIEIHSALLTIVPTDTVIEDNLRNLISKNHDNWPVYHGQSPATEEYVNYQNIALNFIGVFDKKDTPFDEDKCLSLYRRIEENLKVRAENILLSECKAPVQFRYKDRLYEILRGRVTESSLDFVSIEDVRLALSKNKIPFYLYSGALDSYVPRDLFQKEVRALGSLVKYTSFSNSGHEGFYTEKQVFKDLSQ